MTPIKVGSTVYLRVFLFNGAAALAGKTVAISIQKLSNDQYWNATVFQAGFTTNTMTEQTGNTHLEGVYEYVWTHPSGDGEDMYDWSVKYTESGFITYFKGQIQTVVWPVDVQKISSDTTAADNAELFFDGTGYAGGTTKLDVNVATIAANAITATSIATDAITAAKIAADAIGASELAADAVTEIQSGLATAAALATVQSDTDNIQTRIPAALVSGRMDSSVGAVAAGAITAAAIATDAIDADAIAADAVTEIAAGISIPSAATIADAIWDEARSGHTTGGTFGEGVASVQGNVTGSVASVTGAVGSVTGSVGSVVGAVGSVTGAVGSVAAGGITASSIATGAIDADAISADAVTEIQAGLSTLTAAQVNTEVVDAITVDTIAELSQAAPSATPTLATAVMLPYMALRNQRLTTATLDKITNDAGTTITKSTLSDDGTVFTKAEYVAGP